MSRNTEKRCAEMVLKQMTTTSKLAATHYLTAARFFALAAKEEKP